MVFPISGVETNPLILVFLGFTVGILGSFFGVGGGFIITPALNIFGFPITYAIGTGLAQMLGFSTISTLKHRKLGNLDLRLGIISALSAAPAVEVGKTAVLYLKGMGQADSVVRFAYIVLLAGFGAYMLRDYFLTRTQPQGGNPAGLALSRPRFRLPPVISLPRSGIAVSLWLLVALGVVIGLLSGLLGVGGGFIMIPLLIYLVGVPTPVAVGTSLFTILVGSGAYGTFTYALTNQVDPVAALFMLAGSSMGAQIGATATEYTRAERLRFLFALLVLFMAVSVLLKQAGTRPGWAFLSDYSAYLLLGLALGMSLLISSLLVRGIWKKP